ncbi:MAG: J domain-containing protein [Spirochaetia bacterium]
MRLETALRIFGLNPDPSTEELNKAFRRLAKRYHPDSNGERVEWATHQMASINVAYETIRKSIREGRTQSPRNTAQSASSGAQRAKTGAHRPRRGYSRHAAAGAAPGNTPGSSHATRMYARPLGGSARVAFLDAKKRVLEGMHTYYQFGLENVHLRHEGPHRLKYRRATRLVMKGLERFAELWTQYGPLDPESAYARFYTFTDYFYRSMFLERYNNPYSGKLDQLAYGHYRDATRLLDETIRDTFFPGMTGKSVYDPTVQLQICRQEFSNVIAHYFESNWIEESTLKMKLLDSFEKYVHSRPE